MLLDAVRGLPGVSLLEPAHVSLGYPWVPAAEALLRVEEVEAAAAAVPAAEVLLSGPHRFDVDVRGRVVVHVTPSDDAAVRALAATLGAPLGSPHLSVARVARAGSVSEVEATVAPLLPLAARLDVLELTVREPYGWRTVVRAPLA